MIDPANGSSDDPVADWRSFVHRLLQGAFDSKVTFDGSIEDFVETTIDNSARTDARGHFLGALNDAVRSWNPARAESPEQLGRTLDLLVAYTPEPGAAKLIAFLREGWRLPILPASRLYPRDRDLHLRALVALAEYFPTPPLSAIGAVAFDKYVGLLGQHLAARQYVSHAVVRLFELGQLVLDDDLVHMITADEVLLTHLTRRILTDGVAAGSSIMSKLYEDSITKPGAHAVFLSALRANGASLEHDAEHGPAVVGPAAGRVQLVVADAEEYFAQCWLPDNLAKRHELDRLISQAPRLITPRHRRSSTPA